MGHWTDPETPPESKRALRRFYRARKIARIKKWLSRYARLGVNPLEPTGDEAAKLCDNPKFCDHVFCRNKRKLEGPTLREIKQNKSADAKVESWEEEFYD